MPELVEIKGIGPAMAKACAENGYASVEQIAAAMVSEFVAVPGVNEARARQLIDAAKLVLNGAAAPTDVAAADAEAQNPLEKKSKNKNKKKDKKQNKKKGKKSKNKKKKKSKKNKNKKKNKK